MIDLGLSKLVVIGIVALVVIGPKQLPMAVRTLGTLLGRAQRYINQVKAEVSREIESDTLRELQHNLTQATTTFHHNLHNKLNTTIDTLIANPSSTPPDSHQSNTITLRHTTHSKRNKKRIRASQQRRTLFIRKGFREPGCTSYLLSGAARMKRYRRLFSIKKNFFSNF